MIRKREELFMNYLELYKENVELTGKLVELENKVRVQQQSIASLVQHCETELEEEEY